MFVLNCFFRSIALFSSVDISVRRGLMLTAVLVFAVQQPAFAIHVRNDVPVSRYVDLAASPQFAAAGFISAFGSGHCSGTLVAPDKVLTAAHCVDDIVELEGPDFYPEDLMFGTSPNGSEGFEEFMSNVASIDVHPGWRGSLPGAIGGAPSKDLAILTLSQPILDIKPARIAAFNPRGLVGTAVGYGQQGTGTTTGDLPGALDRLAAQNVVDFVELDLFHSPDGALIIRTDFDRPDARTNSLGDATPLPLEGTIGFGDSGGPLFVEMEGEFYVAGVASAIFNNFGDSSLYGNNSIHAPTFTEENLQFLASHGIYPIPEPTSLIVLGIGSVVIFRRRRP